MVRLLGLLTLLSCLTCAASYGGAVVLRSPRASSARHTPVAMKGKGTKGMPGKVVPPPAGSGFNAKSKKRMQNRELSRDEWTLVAAKGELGDEIGDTLAVEAGQSPMGGQNYIWTLIRGPEGAGQFTDDVYSNVWATDGSCRACTFPMTKAVVKPELGEAYALECTACGTKWSLDDGSVLKWLPGEGIGQTLLKKLNEKKEPMECGILKTRVSQSGRVYVRLPDGTLPIAKTAEDRAAELADGAPIREVAGKVAATAKEKILEAQKKAAAASAE